MAKVTEKATLKLAQKVEGEHIFWKSRQWDANLPSYFVLANYPANQLVIADDLTGMLIQAEVVRRGGGSVTIGNLFSSPVKVPTEALLKEAYVENGIDELIVTALKCDQIIIATGSLIEKSETAKFLLREFLSRLNSKSTLSKISILVNQETDKPAHPLSPNVRKDGLEWQLKSLEILNLEH